MKKDLFKKILITIVYGLTISFIFTFFFKKLGIENNEGAKYFLIVFLAATIHPLINFIFKEKV